MLFLDEPTQRGEGEMVTKYMVSIRLRAKKATTSDTNGLI